ncbi:MAG: hypothetical protein HQ486_04535 [Acidimicrobiaceae bacterium]|nr:hypothetical protein [Acidimicrobiaceae bacterium]
MSDKFALIDEMYLEGLALKREQLRRQNPGSEDLVIEEMLCNWINDRPLDSPGQVRIQ